MKIEIGESLLLSWLRHIKECQLVQTNWKPSSKWELKNRELLEKLMQDSSNLFKEKYGYDLYKGNSGISQIISQAEIDVIGISFDDEHIHAIDVAFHEAGLNYGSKDETVTRVIKKCIRTAMCIYGYYGSSNGTIIFTSPKINPAVINSIEACTDDIDSVMKNLGLNYKVRIIANEDFREKVLEPVLNVLGDVADTSELFMRSLQMYNLFAEKKSKTVEGRQKSTVTRRISPKLEEIEYNGINGLEEMKIGVIVRTVLRKMLESGEVSKQEIEQMQTKEYSKETFDIQFPLLQKASLTNGESPKRYYGLPVKINDEDYFLCSEWYEVPANNDRPYLLKWLTLHK
ncbi:MAG: hypothetical protein AB7V16_01380 [Vulcanibacillus sp.]